MELTVKKGATLDGLQEPMILGLVGLYVVWARLFPGRECVITSGKDGKHMVGSFHGKGLALDVRTKTLSSAEKTRFKAELLKELTDRDFDVILEHLGEAEEHLHVEFDPK